MRCVILQHIAHETPGRFLPLLVRAGVSIDHRRLDAGDPVPHLSECDALLVMGGPMSVRAIESGDWPFLAQEITLLRAALAADLPIVGICLGAQLLAHAAGSAVFPLLAGNPPVPLREIGWGPVMFAPEHQGDPLLVGLNAAEIMLHWHGDTFALPPGATTLASTMWCPQQMFRLGAQQVGVQFHPEVASAEVEEWLAIDADYIAESGYSADRIAADGERFQIPYRAAGERLCRNLAELLRGPG